MATEHGEIMFDFIQDANATRFAFAVEKELNERGDYGLLGESFYLRAKEMYKEGWTLEDAADEIQYEKDFEGN